MPRFTARMKVKIRISVKMWVRRARINVENRVRVYR
jgi:hypothetical protein